MPSLKDYLFYSDDWATIYCGDCREILPMIEPVDLVLTDPPYGVNKDENDSLVWNDLKLLLLPIFQLPKLKLIFSSTKSLLNYLTLLPDYLDIAIFYKPYANNRGITTEWNLFDFIIIAGRKPEYRPKDNFYKYELFPTMDGKPHPYPKPLKIIKELVNDYSQINNLIFDPFLGSGTTCVAAKNLNRKSIGIEINPKYCEIAVKRLRQEVFDFRKID